MPTSEEKPDKKPNRILEAFAGAGMSAVLQLANSIGLGGVEPQTVPINIPLQSSDKSKLKEEAKAKAPPAKAAADAAAWKADMMTASAAAGGNPVAKAAAAKAEAERLAADPTAMAGQDAAAKGQQPAAQTSAAGQDAAAQTPAAVVETPEYKKYRQDQATNDAKYKEFEDYTRALEGVDFEKLVAGVTNGGELAKGLEGIPVNFKQKGESQSMQWLNIADLKALNREEIAKSLRSVGEQIKNGALTKEAAQERFNQDLEQVAKDSKITVADLYATFKDKKNPNHLGLAMSRSLKELGLPGISVYDAMLVENTQNTINALNPRADATKDLINAVVKGEGFEYEYDLSDYFAKGGEPFEIDGKTYGKGGETKIVMNAGNMQAINDAMRGGLDTANRYPLRKLNDLFPELPEPPDETPDETPAPSPAPSPTPTPPFEKIKADLWHVRHASLVRADARGERGMGTSDAQINDTVAQNVERSVANFESEAQRYQAMELNNAVFQAESQINDMVRETAQIDDAAKRQEAFNKFQQQITSNPALMPQPGDSPELAQAKAASAQKLIQVGAGAMRQSYREHQDRKLRVDIGQNIQAIVEQASSGEMNDDEAFAQLFLQVSRGNLNPGEKADLLNQGASALVSAGAQKIVQSAIAEAEQNGTHIAGVSGKLQDLSNRGAGFYAALNDPNLKINIPPAFTHIFELEVLKSIAEAKRALHDYNMGVFKTYQGNYENLLNYGMYDEARRYGEGYRRQLNAAAHAGDVAKDFIYGSRDFYKPFVARDGGGAGGGQKLAGLGLMGRKADEVAEQILNWANSGYTTLDGLADPFSLITQYTGELKTLYFQEYPDSTEDPDTVDNKLYTLFRSEIIKALGKRYENEKSKGNIYAGTNRLQEWFSTSDDIIQRLRAVKDGEKKTAALLTSIEGGRKGISGGKDKEWDKDELDIVEAEYNNFAFGLLLDELTRNGGSAFETSESTTEFLRDLNRRSAIALFGLYPLMGRQFEPAPEALKPNGQELHDFLGALAAAPDSFFSDNEAGPSGSAKLYQQAAYNAVVEQLTAMINNLTGKDWYYERFVSPIDDPLGIGGYLTISESINPYVAKQEDNQEFSNRDFKVMPSASGRGNILGVEKTVEEKGAKYVVYRFEFVPDPKNKKKVDIQVYSQPLGTDTWTQQKTITDIGKKGLTDHDDQKFADRGY